MKFTVYLTRNNINGKIYVGVHKTMNPYDSYIGSGKIIKTAIKKHKRSAFTKRVLYVFETAEEAYAKEKEIVNERFIARDDTYNVAIGGSVSPSWSEERKLKHSAKMRGNNHPQFGKKQSPESNIKRSETLTGRKMNPEAVSKSATARKGQVSPFKGQKRFYKNSLKGRSQPAELNAKRSESHRNIQRVKCLCGREITPSNYPRHFAKCGNSTKH